MNNLLKFDPEPFDSELPFEVVARGYGPPEHEDEQEDERGSGRSSRRSARGAAGSAGGPRSRTSAKSSPHGASYPAAARHGQGFAATPAKGSGRHAGSHPHPPGSHHHYHRRGRWFAGAASLDADPMQAGSEHVRWVQTCLNSFLGLNLAVDGILSAPVRSALRTFQERRGLTVNGLIGPETETALRDACQAGGASAPPSEPAPPPAAPPSAASGDPAPADAPAEEIDTRAVPGGSPAAATLVDNAVRVAKEELARWNNGTIKETDPRTRAVLCDYWKTGTGNAYTSAQIGSAAFQAAHPWSAAFISWVMRKAGAGDQFKYSASHSVYTAAAKNNRIAQNSNPFKAYRIAEVSPQVGDLVCKSRAGSGATYDTIRPGMTTHCDIVTATRPGGLEVIGGNVCNSVSRRVVHLDNAGHIKDPGYFAVIRIDAGQPVGPKPVGPKPVGPSGVPGAVPRLLKREATPPGTTLYLEIDLKITDSFGITAPPMTGVFIPDGYTPSGAVDIVLYLHGHKGGEMRQLGIDQYWNATKFPYGAFREGLNNSGQAAILVAPSLGSRSEAGRLVEAGGLDAFMAQVLAGITANGGGSAPLTPGNLILACHSGGGSPMRRLGGGSGAVIGKLQECWGFDCTYNTGDDTFWAGWARRTAARKCYFYYIRGSQTARLAEALRDKHVQNAIVMPSAESRHNYVPLKYWDERLRGSAFLKSRLGGGGSLPPRPPVPAPIPTADPDDVKSLTHPAFIEFVGRHARTAMATSGVPASVTVAQAILETGWGKHTIGDAKNLFGIKGNGPAGSIRVKTREFLDGKWVTVQANFAKYESFAQSVLEHANFLVRNKRYAPAFKFKSDADAFARAIHQAGYATDPQYANKLISLMKQYHLYQFDGTLH